jgi:hypothetical protein
MKKSPCLPQKTASTGLTGEIYGHYDADLTVTAEAITTAASCTTAIETVAGWVITTDDSIFRANKNTIDAPGNTAASHASRITQLADSITATISKVDAITGEEIVSSISQTADAVTIQASKINLTGAITANGNVFINSDGTLVATGGWFNLN